MVRTASVTFCPTLVALLLVHIPGADSRSLPSPVSHQFQPRQDTDVQNRLVALLLHKGLVPISRNEVIGLEMARKMEELEELGGLKEDVDLQNELISDAVGADVSLPSKRSCFWKYCV
ncbi:urotensin 2 domain containing [Paramormyrops kingsleyae]|uniref:Urotensin 2B n=1 Tax=Paramormyrops kingsleyae TaxID=1676925 RepID=A0A3B3RY93_9TELE|nr:urotensin-2B [Paramormyrops kingsleyae]